MKAGGRWIGGLLAAAALLLVTIAISTLKDDRGGSSSSPLPECSVSSDALSTPQPEAGSAPAESVPSSASLTASADVRGTSAKDDGRVLVPTAAAVDAAPPSAVAASAANRDAPLLAAPESVLVAAASADDTPAGDRVPDPTRARASIGVHAAIPSTYDLARSLAERWSGELVVEILAARLARTTAHAYLEEGVLLVPASAVFELLEIRARSDDEGVLRATLEPERVPVCIDPDAGRAWIGNEEIDRHEVKLRETSEGLYVGVPLLRRLLGVRTWFDLGELTLLLEPVDHLPLGRRMARQRAHESLLARRDAPPPDRLYRTLALGLQGATIDWSMDVPSHEDLGRSWGRVAFGVGIMGGAFALNYNQRADGLAPPGTDKLTANWVGAWPERKWMRQLRFGSILGPGPRPRAINGVAVGNSPYVRPRSFGQTVLSGQLPGEWDVELYRNGELSDFARADRRGYFELDAPLDYGTNPVEVRAYGPNGEMRVLTRALPVGHDRLPAGRFEYEVGGGECARGSRQASHVGNLDLRYGIDGRWTGRVGIDAFRRTTLANLVHPYVGISGALSRHWAVSAEAIRAASRGARLEHVPSPDFRSSIAHVAYDTKIEDPVLTPAGVLTRTWLDLFWRPWSRNRTVHFDFHGQRTRDIYGRQLRGVLQGTTQRAGVRWTLQWAETHTRRQSWEHSTSELELGGSTVLHLPSASFLKGIFCRGSVGFDAREQRLERGSLAVGGSLGKGLRIEFAAAWINPTQEARISIGLSTNGANFRTFSHLMRSAEGDYTGSTYMDGSLVWNDAISRWEPFPYRSTGRGGLSGTAFVDANANGWQDPDEDPVGSVELRAGDKSATTDSQGRYSLWNLTPFEATNLTIRQSSLENPLLVPPFKLAAVHVTPNGFREVNIPLTPGVEVMGRLVLDKIGHRPSPGGRILALRHLATGTTHETTTFQDGRFYFMAVPPGEYEVMMQLEDLQHVGCSISQATRYQVIPSSADVGGSYEFEIDLVPAAVERGE